MGKLRAPSLAFACSAAASLSTHSHLCAASAGCPKRRPQPSHLRQRRCPFHCLHLGVVVEGVVGGGRLAVTSEALVDVSHPPLRSSLRSLRPAMSDSQDPPSTTPLSPSHPSAVPPSGSSPLSPTSSATRPLLADAKADSNGRADYADGGRGGDRSDSRDRDADSRRRSDAAPVSSTSASVDGAAASSGGVRVAFRKSARKVYVGNLPSTASEKDILDLFASAPLPCPLPAQVDMKAGYAFVVSAAERRHRQPSKTATADTRRAVQRTGRRV